MWLHVTCEFSFEVAVTTPMVFMLRPRSSPTQWVAGEEYRLTPPVQVVEYADGFGNLCQRLVAPVGEFQINTAADVQVANQPTVPAVVPYINVPELPDEVLGFLLPSRYCESDRFGQMATIEHQAEVAARAQLEDLARTIDVEVTDVHVKIGGPALEIRQGAENLEVDLIVIGTHGRHGLGLLLGSTANGVLHGVKCDVLTVRIK